MLTVLGLVQATLLLLIIRMHILRRRQWKAIDEKLERLQRLLSNSKITSAPVNNVAKLYDEDLDALEDLIHRARELRKPRRW
jgi:CRISPR/Cas system CSM-associated protein Csm4 (group 5 of RAMP superfamily)